MLSGFQIHSEIVETWAIGWTLAKEVAPPIKINEYIRINVTHPLRETRYIFFELGPLVTELINTITESNTLLKICAPPEEVNKILPPNWHISQVGYMMIITQPMLLAKHDLPVGYYFECAESAKVPIVRIFANDGDMIASGRIVFVNGYAVYDRIETDIGYRRKGIPTFIMHLLENLAKKQGINKAILVATIEGRLLYEALGWQLYSPYTTASIKE